MARQGGKPASRSTGGAFVAGFRQHQDTAVDSLARLLRDPFGSLLTWTVIGIALALPLSLLLLVLNLQQLGSGLERAGRVSLFMESKVPEAELQSLAQELSARSDVAGVELITADAALAEFTANSGFGEVLQGLGENPLPPVLLVTPGEGSAQEAEALRAALAAFPGVDVAQLDLQWLQRLESIVGVAGRLAWLLALMLGVGVILVIGNTVRLAIENRRAEIVVVKLVGGTDGYVARPFLYTGLWYGVGGGLLAVLLIALALFGLGGPVTRLMSAYGSDFVLTGLSFERAVLVLAAAALLGWAGAWFSVRRHLRAIEPR